MGGDPEIGHQPFCAEFDNENPFTDSPEFRLKSFPKSYSEILFAIIPIPKP